MVSVAYVCSQLCGVAISRLHRIRLLHFRRLPHRRQIQSAWQESRALCAGKLRWFGRWLLPFRITSKHCVFRLLSTLCSRTHPFLARNSVETSPCPFHARGLQPLPPPLILLHQEIIPLFVHSNAHRTTSWRRIQRPHFPVHATGVQCRHVFVQPCACSIQSCDGPDAWSFASGMAPVVLLILCVLTLFLLIFVIPDFAKQAEMFRFPHHSNWNCWPGSSVLAPCLFQ